MSEEEVELRDLVAQTLENKGILSKIRVRIKSFNMFILCCQQVMSGKV